MQIYKLNFLINVYHCFYKRFQSAENGMILNFMKIFYAKINIFTVT